jgi:hypothetical protein
MTKTRCYGGKNTKSRYGAHTGSRMEEALTRVEFRVRASSQAPVTGDFTGERECKGNKIILQEYEENNKSVGGSTTCQG